MMALLSSAAKWTYSSVEALVALMQDFVLPGTTLLVVVSSTVGYVVVSWLWKWWGIQQRIGQKKLKCQDSFNKLEKYLQDHRISQKVMKEILELSFTELRSQQQRGALKAEDVLKAYQTKALEVNNNCNCVVEPVLEANDDAVHRDTERKKQLLWGIPVSLKENYFIKGYDSTGGMSLFLNNPAKEDGNLVKVLKYQGAVPFVRTNIPQGMITFECSNPIYGETLNPHNPKRGPGGSSGGEAAILGAGASILGWGTDIGGSLRIPAHFCGVASLKPTTGRISNSSKTCEELVYGQNLIVPTCGPMARDVDTLAEAMKAVLCPYHFELDPEIPPVQFNTQVYESQEPLRIGYYKFDGSTRCIPGVERAVDEAVEALKKMGHTVVPFEPPRVEEIFGEVIVKILFGDGGETFLYQTGEDFVDPSIQLIVWTYRLPVFVQRIIAILMSLIAREKLPKQIMTSMNGASSVGDWWRLSERLEKYKREFLAAWKAVRLDAVVCPVMPYVAVPTGQVKYLLGGASYTSLYNALNYPAGVVPVTKVTAIDQAKMKDYPATKGSEKAIKSMFSADTENLPVCVQCVGLPFQEELVLRVMRDVETGLSTKPAVQKTPARQQQARQDEETSPDTKPYNLRNRNK